VLLFAISCAWVLGIFLGAQYRLSGVLIFTGLLPVPLLFIFNKHRQYLIIMALSLATLFGAAFYYPSSVHEDKTLAIFNNTANTEIKGVISAEPDVRDNVTHIQVSVEEIKVENSWQNTQGKVLAFVPRYPEYRYGDILWLKGELEDPPKFDNFDYQAYLAQEDIFSTMDRPAIEIIERGTGSAPLKWIYALRNRLSQTLSATLPEPHASLAQGIVLGIRSTIPDSLKTNLSITGTAHLLAISGINLSIIAGVLVSLGLLVFGRRHYIYVWLALFVIWFYSLLTGMQSPVVRSSIMATIFLFAELLGRQKNAFAALAFTAAIMVGITPHLLWDASFQLSFLAMAGLIFIAPSLQTLARKMVYSALGNDTLGARTVAAVTDSFCISLAAVIAVWPVIAYYFGIVSLVGPLSTFVIAPALSLIIFLGAITAIIGLASLPVAQVFGWTAWLFLSYMLWLVNAFASLPMASINTGAINNGLFWIYYAVLMTLIWLKANYKKTSTALFRFISNLKSGIIRTANITTLAPKKWTIAPLIVVAFLTSFAAATMPDNNLHVSVLDVGEGDAILIQSGSQNVLVDGGPSPQAISLGLSGKIPFWNRNLDLVILTHPHLDHLSGLIEVMNRYQVAQVLAPNLISTSPAYQEWLSLIKIKDIKFTLAQAGQKIKLENGTLLQVLNPQDTAPSDTESDMENNGIVMRMNLKQVSFLFTADIGQEAEKRLIRQTTALSCNILKVAHHGSATSTSSGFLSVASPQITVISVGADNNFGHPNKVVLDRLKDTQIFRTDERGTIEFTTNGENLWVKAEK
jgi:competence protein ComEC